MTLNRRGSLTGSLDMLGPSGLGSRLSSNVRGGEELTMHQGRRGSILEQLRVLQFVRRVASLGWELFTLRFSEPRCPVDTYIVLQ